MKTYIWGIPTRLFHWLLATGFIIAYILSDFEDYMNFHFAFGLMVGILIIFRLIYGLIGPKYSLFSNFPFCIRNQINFIKTFFDNSKKYAGHNPPASFVMILIFIVGISCSLSGYLLYKSNFSENILFFNKEILEEIHEIFANLLLGLVILHLLGIISDTIFHYKVGTLKSIFTGFKNIEDENIKSNLFLKIFAVIWFTAAIFVFYQAYNFTKISENEVEQQNSIQNEDEDD